MTDKCIFNGVLTPAYGRDYPSKAKVLVDLNANLDFNGHFMTAVQYINLEQIADGSRFTVRYGKLLKVILVHVVKGKAKTVNR